MLISQFLGRLRLSACALLVSSTALAEMPDFYDEPGSSPSRISEQGLTGDSIDPFGGQLTVTHTDMSIPGNGGMDLNIVRSWSIHNSIVDTINDGVQAKVQHALGLGWDIHFGRIYYGNPLNPGAGCLKNRVKSDLNPVFEMADGSKRQLVEHGGYIYDTSNSSHRKDLEYMTKDYWVADCVSAPYTDENGEQQDDGGLKVADMEGTTYLLNRRDMLKTGQIGWVATEIRDLRGNWIKIDYLPRASTPFALIDKVTTRDGRVVRFNYDSSHRLESIVGEGQTVRYAYEALSSTFSNIFNLVEVDYGEGLKWKYGYKTAGVGRFLIEFIENPYGGRTDYTYQRVQFESNNLLSSTAVASKNVSGRDVETGTWTYQFTPGNSFDQTLITTPVSQELYKHFGARSASNENVWRIGTLLEKSIFDLAADPQVDEPLEQVLYEWGPIKLADQNEYRASRNAVDSYTYMPRLTKQTTIREGSRYVSKHYYLWNGIPDVTEEFGESLEGALCVPTTPTDGSEPSTSHCQSYKKAYKVYYNFDLFTWRMTKYRTDLDGAGYRWANIDDKGLMTSDYTWGGYKTGDYTYDSEGNLETYTDPNSLVTRYSDYYRGIARTETRNENVVINKTVNSDGTIASVTNGRQHTTEYLYDPLQRVKKIIPPLNNSTSINWTHSGSDERTVTRGGLSDKVKYDSFGRVIQRSVSGDGKTITTDKAYDAAGRLIFSSYPNSTSGIRYEYDALGRIKKMSEPGGKSTNYQYLSKNRTKVTDPEGKSTTYKYRAYGDPDEKELMEIHQSEGVSTLIERHVLGLVTKITQGGVVRQFGYNHRKQLSQIVDPEAGFIELERNPAGNIILKKVAGKETIGYHYDDLLRVKEIRYADRTLLEGQVVEVANCTIYPCNYSIEKDTDFIQYDANSNITSIERKTQTQHVYIATATSPYPVNTFSNSSSLWVNNYNENDALTDETLTLDGVSYRLDYIYDLNDQLNSIIYPSNQVVDYAPDAFGRPTKVGAYVNAIDYHDSGQLKSMTYGNGVTTQVGISERLIPDSLAVTNGVDLVNKSYVYDLVDNVKSITDAVRPEQSKVMSYDGLHRLKTVSGPWGNASYDYDLTGNITSKTLGAKSYTYSYGVDSNLLEKVSTNFDDDWLIEHDVYGNMIDNGRNKMAYDALGNLLEIKDSSFFYDARDRRVLERQNGIDKVTLYNKAGSLMFEANTSERIESDYVYLAGKLVAKREVDLDKPPVLTIVAPTHNAVVYSQSVLGFAATVADDFDTDLAAKVEWSSSIDGNIGTGAEFSRLLSEGVHTITATVTDSARQTVRESVTIDVSLLGNRSPELLLASPQDGSSHYLGDSLTLSASASDYEDGDLSSAMQWKSSLDGNLGTGANVSVNLSAGVHTITARAVDSSSAAASSSVVITVAANEKPALQIIEPVNNKRISIGMSLTFSASAIDPEDGDLIANVEWFSSLDGVLGVGNNVSANLSAGTHAITAKVSDSRSLQSTQSIQVEVLTTADLPPLLTVIKPVNGSGHSQWQGLIYEATAIDPEDGDLSAQVEWYSDIDGFLGKGNFTDWNTSKGIHRITASVTDSFGNREEKVSVIYVGVPVNAAPELIVQSPLNNSSITVGEPLLLQATATDAEDGDLGLAIRWSSNIDGDLGSGLSVNAALTSGTHILTAAVSDSAQIETSVTLVVNVTATADSRPTLTIAAPLNNSEVNLGDVLSLQASAGDLEDGNISTLINWNSSNDGLLGNGANISANLTQGVHILTAKVTDSGNNSVEESVTVTVKAPVNVEPSFGTILPADNSSFLTTDAIAFSATATDTEDGDLSTAIVWSSNVDGVLGTGTTLSKSLSAGAHVINLSVTDSNNVEVTATINVVVTAPNTGPVFGAILPADNSSFLTTDAIAFSATATDTEDGDLSTAIIWSSNVDGVLGTGATLSKSLSAGAHVINLSATDSDSAETTATINVVVTAPNTGPVFGAILPADNSSFLTTDTIAFSATATDTEDGDLSTAIVWSSNLDGVLGTGATLSKSLSAGAHVINLSVTDSNNVEVAATINVVVTAPNIGPVLDAILPADNSSFLTTDAIAFSATATDAEDGDLSTAIVWSSSIDGALGTGATLSKSLSVGSHMISLSVIDSNSAETTATINVVVTAPNTGPVFGAILPADNSSFLTTDTIAFSATATDTEDGDLSTAIVWSSNVDGVLGTGATLSKSLSAGAHVINLSVTDSDSVETTATINVVVTAPNSGPVFGAILPADNSSFLTTDAIAFSASASDAEDGDLSAAVVWSSNVDGVLGTGATLSKSLSAGAHVINLSVTDSNNVEVAATINVVVTAPNTGPVFGAILPADNSSFLTTDAIAFSASASDAEDGDLSAAVVWSSNIDGALGSGATLSKSLSAGAHVINLSVTDSNNVEVAATINVVVTAPNTGPVFGAILPADNSSFLTTDAIAFSATATDTEDGDLSTAIVWSSSIDGALGTGTALSKTLTAGSHVITVAVTDSGGVEAIATLNVTITGPINVAPTLANMLPSNGSSFGSTEPVNMSATASDSEDGDLSASIVWNSNIDGPLGTGASISKLLSAGSHTITATVTDSHGLEYSVSNVVSIVAPRNVEPNLVGEILPRSGTYSVNDDIAFSASATDEEDGDVSASITWTSSIDGALGTGASFSRKLSAGIHLITVSVKDSQGLETLVPTNYQIRVLAANTAPVLSNVSPASGSAHSNREGIVVLSATAMDVEDGDISGSIVWTSSLDGQLGTGASINSALSEGHHVITLAVTDADGLQASLDIQVQFVTPRNSMPHIGSMLPGSVSVSADDLLTFSAVAIDQEDGDISALIEWNSSIDGAIGTGTGFSRKLSPGIHDITLSVTDSGGMRSGPTGFSMQVLESIDEPPALNITSPLDGSTFSQWEVISFRADSSDAEDGLLFDSVEWSSSIAGHLGKGNYSNWYRAKGEHIITAVVTDSYGNRVEQQITITVQ